MSNPIDAAFEELLRDIGDGWFLSSVCVDEIDATSISQSRSVPPTKVTVVLRHPEGLISEGTAHTLGNAAATAVMNLVRQELRQRSAEGS